MLLVRSLESQHHAPEPVSDAGSHPNLSKDDNTDQRSWLAVDQVMKAKNPLTDFRTPHKVNHHARIQEEQLVLRGL